MIYMLCRADWHRHATDGETALCSQYLPVGMHFLYQICNCHDTQPPILLSTDFLSSTKKFDSYASARVPHAYLPTV